MIILRTLKARLVLCIKALHCYHSNSNKPGVFILAMIICLLHVVQDRKQHIQWNKDPVRQVNYKNIGTYRPHYMNGFHLSNPSTSSGISNQTSLSLPNLSVIPEDSIISVENGELVPNTNDVHNPITVTLTESLNSHITKLRSASMDELNDDITSRCTINPLHNSDDSNLHLSSTSKDELLSETLATTSSLHVSDEPKRQMNGFVHHALTNDDQSSHEGGHNGLIVNNTKKLSAKFNDTKDTSILALSAVL